MWTFYSGIYFPCIWCMFIEIAQPMQSRSLSPNLAWVCSILHSLYSLFSTLLYSLYSLTCKPFKSGFHPTPLGGWSSASTRLFLVFQIFKTYFPNFQTYFQNFPKVYPFFLNYEWKKIKSIKLTII